jgi:hypothetical protein
MLKELHKPTPTAVFVVIVVVKGQRVLRQINALRVKIIENLARVKCMGSFYFDPIKCDPTCLSGEDDG